MRALVVGATAGVGRALTEVLAAHGYSLIMVATDACDLKNQADYLRLKYGVCVKIVAADASKPEMCIENICLAAEDFGQIDGLFFPIGASKNNDYGTLSVSEARLLIDVNFLIIVAVIGHFLPKFLASKHGSIVGFGSVAAIRGRGANMVYAAAKRGLESYFQSLRHLVSNTAIRVQFYRLGYIATQQSFGKKLLFSPASSKMVAEEVFSNLNNSQSFFHYPRYWAIVAKLVAVMPWSIFKRLKF